MTATGTSEASCAEPGCPLGVEEGGTFCGFHAETAPDSTLSVSTPSPVTGGAA